MKTTTMNISLPAELARYVREKVDSGRYASVSEVVREALRRWAGQEAGEAPATFRTLGGSGFDLAKARAAVRGIRDLQDTQVLGDDLTPEDLVDQGRQA